MAIAPSAELGVIVTDSKTKTCKLDADGRHPRVGRKS